MTDLAGIEPPNDLKPAAAARWRDVVGDLAARGRVDVEALRTYSQVYARWREAEELLAKTSQIVKKGNSVVASPLIAISKEASAQVFALEQRLGIGQATEPEAPDAADLCTRRELAQRLGVHMQTVTKWEAEGLPIAQRGSKGRASHYSEREIRGWLAAREKAAQTGNGVDLVRERAEKERWQGRLAEQQYQLRQRQLLPAEEVERIWAGEIAAVRTMLLAWPQVISDQVHRAAIVDGVPGVEAVLHQAVRDVLRDLSSEDREITGRRAS